MRRLGFFMSAMAGLGAITAMPCVIDAQSGRTNEQQAEALSATDNPLLTSAGRRYMTEQPRHWRACMIQR
jgi:hypothetical protein